MIPPSSASPLLRAACRLEVCAGGVADAELAARQGADRIELCAAPELGGLTPSIGLLQETLARQPLPVVAMNRPRAGGFRYAAAAFAAMLRDARALVAAGASGVVFGVLQADGRLDVPRCRALREAIGDAEAVFHRGFDFLPDPPAALEQRIELGVDRVVTSGGQPAALAGAELLGQLVRQAAGRIEILPGGRIRGRDVAPLLRLSGCSPIHVGASGPGRDPSLAGRPELALADPAWLDDGGYRAVDPGRLREIVAALRAA